MYMYVCKLVYTYVAYIHTYGQAHKCGQAYECLDHICIYIYIYIYVN